MKVITSLFLLLFLIGCTSIPQDQPTACTMDAKQCPDGSYVGRVGPNCEFEKCPEITDDTLCTKINTDLQMSLEDAKNIAMNSECVKEGSLTDDIMCNDNTGTWWINLDIEKPGCLPACVINVETKETEINWRCTGLIEPDKVNSFTEEESRQIAQMYMENAPTYKYDGMELELTEIQTLRCPSCFQFTFEFESRRAGYGDRTDIPSGAVITPHTAIITIEQGEVTTAIMDEKWNMKTQELI